MKKKTIKWLPEPEEHNYPAARKYLALMYPDLAAHKTATELRDAQMTEFKAKDIFRASGLSLLGVSNSHVRKDLDKIASKTPLSPLLLVRNTGVNPSLIVADGYHRLCAVYRHNEDAVIPCKIV